MLEIKDTESYGKGVFATEDIPKNTKIQDYVGIEMSYSDFKKQYDDIKYCYSMKRINKILVAKDYPYNEKNISHFMNESNNPNIIFKKKGVYTLKDIKKGEECLLKYPKHYKRDYVLKD